MIELHAYVPKDCFSGSILVLMPGEAGIGLEPESVFCSKGSLPDNLHRDVIGNHNQIMYFTICKQNQQTILFLLDFVNHFFLTYKLNKGISAFP